MISTVAVGTDGSATAQEALKTAAEVARRFEAEVVLISAFESSKGARSGGNPEREWASNPASLVREILSRAEQDLQAQGITVRTMVDEGDPADVLVRLAEEAGADLLVVGNKGMQRRVLGSVPNTITHKAGCSVLVVKTT
jgi:nucleotide-binding universal stress UspA family protein